ncbi:conserved hypothetical protein [Hyella patelloides LEGE 07179]|uniref:Uncharacterized protein n=1 Tax=Hyella patelloides LEGE 07179 TaxID=945734 RepID=A0A563VYI5_9CYAN|nr:hypothetical protein [Hyella patelloides]VEP16333.1 conserved hypothetical protein [Hyella patelloides LEGE 07179]
MLSEVHRQFTPRELAFTGLELRHKEMETEQPKVNAGRARNKNQDIAEPVLDLSSGSITTTIGFLLNMVQRTIQLISPCIATERWKDGYRIHETRQFTDACDLKVVMEEMIDYHMPLTLPATDIVRFRPELKFEPLATGFQVGTKHKTYKFTHSA